MRRKIERITIPKQSFSPVDSLQQIDIRSRHFYKNRIPKIHNKDIPTHNAFGITLQSRQKSNEDDQIESPRLWAALVPPQRKRIESPIQPPPISSRPQMMLRRYLGRKDKLSYGPQINPQSYQNQQKSQKKANQTVQDFRIKHSSKHIAFNTVNSRSLKQKTTLKLQDETQINIIPEFMNFNPTKKLYDMTHEELQASIQWKKKFLELLTTKIRSAKQNDRFSRTFR